MNELKNMLVKLFAKDEVANIPYEQIYNSFNEVGKRYDMGNGKWCEPIYLKDDEILIKGFMPKGTSYIPNEHDNADEIVTVITGVLRCPILRLTRLSMGQFKWLSGTPHDLIAKTDVLFYAKFNKV